MEDIDTRALDRAIEAWAKSGSYQFALNMEVFFAQNFKRAEQDSSREAEAAKDDS